MATAQAKANMGRFMGSASRTAAQQPMPHKPKKVKASYWAWSIRGTHARIYECKTAKDAKEYGDLIAKSAADVGGFSYDTATPQFIRAHVRDLCGVKTTEVIKSGCI